MESTRWEQAQSLFHQALELPGAARQAFLDSACGGDAGLMAEVRAMLEADGGPSLLDDGLSSMAQQFLAVPAPEIAAREIGPYKLIRVLGEGGMGVVWLAQREDTGAIVAVKLLLGAGFSPARRERFTREIKTLAKLRHPYIARLYDAGALPDGTPWFVMEHIEGERLVDYCRTHKLSIDERLHLFQKICEAVQYAHSQEIIHRDLKPSNILVEKDGTPRLLDFGIARELQVGDDTSDHTRPGLRFHSPYYAAPEWLRDGAVGFYTDVYSLGMILYELLAGKLPIDLAKSAEENELNLSKAPPEKPSLAARADDALGKDANKQAWPDLDLLCLKAMRWDAGERYQSVEALLRDLNHYLSSEPLEARPDSVRYRAGKFILRNHRAVITASLSFAILVGLVTFFTIHLAIARNEALAQAARTQRIQRFIFDLFKGDDNEAGPSQDLRVSTLLDRGVEKAEALNREPEVQAELYRTLGETYSELGKYDLADTLLAAAMKKDQASPKAGDLAVADDLIEIALLRDGQAKYKEAESLARRAVTLIEGHRPLDASRQARATTALGTVLVEGGNYARGADILTRAVALQTRLDANSTELADTLGNLGDAQLYLGHYDEAESLYRRALSIDRANYSGNHPAIAQDLINLADIAQQLGHYDEAEKDNRQALQITQAWYGTEHPDTARQMAHLASSLYFLGREDEAEHLLRDSLAIEERIYGPNDPHIAYTLNALSPIDQDRGDLDAAVADVRRSITIYKAAYGDNDYRVAVAISNLGSVYLESKHFAEAEPIFRQALTIYAKSLPPDDVRTAECRVKLGRALLRQGRYQEAEPHTLAAYNVLSKQTAPDTSFVKGARHDLAQIYTALHEPDRAKEFQTELASAAPTPASHTH
jgi:eukaryotic-like serine/threonine-protein kinase